MAHMIFLWPGHREPELGDASCSSTILTFNGQNIHVIPLGFWTTMWRPQQGEWPNLRRRATGTGVPRGCGRPHICVVHLADRLTGTAAGVAVLLALYPGQTDMTCRHTTPLPQTNEHSVVWVKAEDPSPRLLLQPAGNSLALFLSIDHLNPTTSQPGTAQHRDLTMSASQQGMAEIGWQS